MKLALSKKNAFGCACLCSILPECVSMTKICFEAMMSRVRSCGLSLYFAKK